MDTTPVPGSTSAFAVVNGLSLYYEVHGVGEPLVLIHGGGSSIETTFGRILPTLAQTHRVIAVELQGHGRTADRSTPLRFSQDADDVAALLTHLQIESADVIGFSNGANSAFELARRYPARVRRVVAAAGFLKRDGIPEALWEMFRKPVDLSQMPAALRESYLQRAPDPSKLPEQAAKLMERLNTFEDWTNADIRSIETPILLMIGDRDAILPEHAVFLYRTLRAAQLAIIPGALHGAYLGEASTPADCPACVEASLTYIARFLGTPLAELRQ